MDPIETLENAISKSSCLVCTVVAIVISSIPVASAIIFALFAFLNPDRPAWYGIVQT